VGDPPLTPRERVEQARENTRDRVEQARETTRERVEQARETTRERVENAREATLERTEPIRMTTRRLFGLDRSGPPPAATLEDAPWNVWTIPNGIGFFRLALIPVFLVLALSSDNGTDALPAVIFAVIGWSDYADGLAARITGQYSRFGALLDPIVDRLLVISGIVVVWNFDLLPRWALGLMVFREVLMLVGGRMALNRGATLRINWPGRLAVGPTMSAVFFALVNVHWLALVMLYLGLTLGWLATYLYIRDARRQIAAQDAAPSSSG
jgi:cardiolipin synthase